MQGEALSEHVHRITWEQLFGGHAEVHIPPEGLVRLAECAGAPWNDHDPEAKLSPLQMEIITTPERTVVVFGGSRGGKSIAGAVIGLGALMIPNCQIALIGANYEHCGKEFGYLWRGFFKLFPRSSATEAQFVNRQPHFSMRLATLWGSRVSVFSINSKEGAQILGNEFDLAILCEAAQVPADIYNTKVERALLGRAKKRAGSEYLRKTGRAILLTTPKQQGGASYDIYSRAVARTRGKIEKLRLKDDGSNWFDSVYFKQANVMELNPSYPKEAFEHARRTLPKYSFEEQFLGLPVLRSGLCYSSFREDTHVLSKDRMPSRETLARSIFGVGIDTGNNFAAVLAALTPEGKAFILGEVFEVGQNSRQNGEAVLAMVEQKLQPLGISDPKGAVQLWVVDVNSQSIYDLEESMEVAFVCQKYEVNETINSLDVRYGNGEIFISEECEFLLNEMRGYRWRKPKELRPGTKDTPVGEDHLLDAKRYLLMQLFEQGPPKEDEAVWTVDQMLEKERTEMLTCNLKRDLENMHRRQANSLLEGRW